MLEEIARGRHGERGVSIVDFRFLKAIEDRRRKMREYRTEEQGTRNKE